ncbi:CDP-diacylglycerol--glycerol-3-phosphate 3-phosphatidyltransferase [Clostridium thermarum]|uniref:CDP-diacylglycerol--glycerol-3-phosphate 3-phosphatidyltransferase n=1 Tax=Clostridium thermarum TaxID=1716543 RepID=UPI0013D65B46|nr:CDP-diacylglycerol--glycerol-3-phosphate 3-phosphatidyltransferase [Clostridium thermarum]
MNLANKLTVLRIFLVPLFLIFIAIRDIPYGSIMATLVFIIAALTDKLDGYIARSRNQITKFGKFLDPLADKLLVTAALISLVEYRIIPAWPAVIIIAREFAVSGLRTIAASEGLVIAASWWGKIKTVIQIIAIIIALLQFNLEIQPELAKGFAFIDTIKKFLPVLTEVSLYLTVIITLLSGYDYFVKNKHVIKIEK